MRISSPELVHALCEPDEGELEPVKRAALFMQMNELACGNQVVVPVVYRPRVAAISSKLRADISGWDGDLGNLKEWYREA